MSFDCLYTVEGDVILTPFAYFIHLLLLLSFTVPPQIVLSPSDAEIETGNNISLTCTAEGTSLMNIAWTKGDTVLINNPKFTITTHAPNNFTLTSELLFETTLEDTGLYSCTAVNAIGNDTRSFNLIIISE